MFEIPCTFRTLKLIFYIRNPIFLSNVKANFLNTNVRNYILYSNINQYYCRMPQPENYKQGAHSCPKQIKKNPNITLKCRILGFLCSKPFLSDIYYK